MERNNRKKSKLLQASFDDLKEKYGEEEALKLWKSIRAQKSLDNLQKSGSLFGMNKGFTPENDNPPIFTKGAEY